MTDYRQHVMSERELKLMQKAQNLEQELRMALLASEDIRALKAKCKSLSNQLWLEKQARNDIEAEKVAAVKKSDILYDQLEKLMFQFKLLSAAKMRESQANHEGRELELKYKKMIMKVGSVIKTAKSYIHKLKTTTKGLEDQLVLMDEKFNQLRVSLDAAQRYHVTIIKSTEHERHELRLQLAHLNGGKIPYTPKSKVKTFQEETDFIADDPGELKQPDIIMPEIRPATSCANLSRGTVNARPHSAAASTSSRSSRRAVELQRILGKVHDRQQKQNAVPGESAIWSKEKLNKLLQPFL